MKTLVIIPAYNEEESILRVVRNLENADIDCDYIVINDCSKDSTGKILDDNNINHVDLPVNLGLTGAVQTNMLIIIIMTQLSNLMVMGNIYQNIYLV